MVFAMQQNGVLALTRPQRGMGGDIVKLWFEEAQADDPKLWGAPMNLQNIWSNLPNKAKQFLESPHNPENVMAPARTDEDATD